MRGGYFLGLLILVTTISMGCGAGSGTHMDVAAGQLAVSPSTLNFGKVAVGHSATKTGTLKAGNSQITVTSADWRGEGFSISGIVFPVTIAAGQSVSYKVTFAPQKSGSSSGNISFLSDAANSPHGESLTANGSQGGAHSVTLAWANTGSKAGYNIYRATAAKGPFAKLNSNPHPTATFTDASVESGQTYFYVTTALNQRGKESKFSNQVQVTIPNS
jgi:uncharacterized protein YfiM (DUF2279 family)